MATTHNNDQLAITLWSSLPFEVSVLPLRPSSRGWAAPSPIRGHLGCTRSCLDLQYITSSDGACEGSLCLLSPVFCVSHRSFGGFVGRRARVRRDLSLPRHPESASTHHLPSWEGNSDAPSFRYPLSLVQLFLECWLLGSLRTFCNFFLKITLKFSVLMLKSQLNTYFYKSE